MVTINKVYRFEKKKYKQFIFVAEIKGYISKLAIVGVTKKTIDIIFKIEQLTQMAKDFPALVNNILSMVKERYDIKVTSGCIGFAGVVSLDRNSVKLTNADVEINKQTILDRTPLNKIILLNDFEAIGYGVDLLDIEKDVIKIPHIGQDLTFGKTETHPFAVIGVGADLGMAIANYDKTHHLHIPMASGGGHMDFAPTNKLEYKFVDYIKKKKMKNKKSHPELERILSIDGIRTIFEFLHEEGYKLNSSKDMMKKKGILLVQDVSANYKSSKLCKTTIDIFMSIYARTCKNLALISQCYSGLYITDIIVLKDIKSMETNRQLLMQFMKNFEQHDKHTDVLQKIPVYMITNKDVGLFGCANVAANLSNFL